MALHSLPHGMSLRDFARNHMELTGDMDARTALGDRPTDDEWSVWNARDELFFALLEEVDMMLLTTGGHPVAEGSQA